MNLSGIPEIVKKDTLILFYKNCILYSISNIK